MSQESAPYSSNSGGLLLQRSILQNLREGQHKTLTELGVPQLVAQYALLLGIGDVVAQEVLREPQKNQYFLWRQDITCIPNDETRPSFRARAYKIGMPVGESTASVFLPNIAARTFYPDGSIGTLFPATISRQIARSVIRMTDEVHNLPELPGLTGIHPQILSPEQIDCAAPELWPAADETDLIPVPWHQASVVVSTETIIL